jgi:hypothetical protein
VVSTATTAATASPCMHLHSLLNLIPPPANQVGAYLDIDVNSDVLSTQDKEADATVGHNWGRVRIVS